MKVVEDSTAPNILTVKTTGAIVDLSGETDELLLHADDISEQIHELRAAKAAITDVIARRLDRANVRQGTFGRMHVKVNAPTERVWDIDGLRQKLWLLVEEGVLDASVIDRLTPSTVEYKVAGREANKLRKHDDPRVGEAIEESESFPKVTRYLTLKPITAGGE